jgi:hypothetical protein
MAKRRRSKTGFRTMPVHYIFIPQLYMNHGSEGCMRVQKLDARTGKALISTRGQFSQAEA